jgi:hypothetical protein
VARRRRADAAAELLGAEWSALLDHEVDLEAGVHVDDVAFERVVARP